MTARQYAWQLAGSLTACLLAAVVLIVGDLHEGWHGLLAGVLAVAIGGWCGLRLAAAFGDLNNG